MSESRQCTQSKQSCSHVLIYGGQAGNETTNPVALFPYLPCMRICSNYSTKKIIQLPGGAII